MLYPALALRLFLISTHYRQAVNYTQRALEEVQPLLGRPVHWAA